MVNAAVHSIGLVMIHLPAVYWVMVIIIDIVKTLQFTSKDQNSERIGGNKCNE